MKAKKARSVENSASVKLGTVRRQSMSPKNLSALLLVIAVLFGVLALATLAPFSSGSPAMVSDLGYYTLCPFAPYSTLTLLFVAGLAWMVRRYIDNQRSNT
jgi:hypothetical protein